MSQNYNTDAPQRIVVLRYDDIVKTSDEELLEELAMKSVAKSVRSRGTESSPSLRSGQTPLRNKNVS